MATLGTPTPQQMPEKPAQGSAGAGADIEQCKAAIAKMDPEMLHRLVQEASSGKFGPQAQQTAQKAMRSGSAGVAGDGDADDTGADQQAQSRDYSSIFSGRGDGDADDQPATPPNRASMFQGSRGGM